MGDYVPVYIPSKVATFTASGNMKAGDMVEVAGSDLVRTCSTNISLTYIGIAGDDTSSGGRVTVYCRGFVHESIAEGTVTAGDQLNTSGGSPTAGSQVVTAAATAATPGKADVDRVRGIIGVALRTATNPAKVRWMEY